MKSADLLPAGGRNGLPGAVGRSEGLLKLCQLCRNGLRAQTLHLAAGAVEGEQHVPLKRRDGAAGDWGEGQGHKKTEPWGTPAVGVGSSPSATAST